MAVFAALFTSLLTLGAAETASVCAIIAEPGKYNGHLVTINGVFEKDASGDWSPDLLPLQSERCFRAARRDELTISITGPDESFQASAPEGFKFDPDSWERAEQALVQLLAKEPNLRFVNVTVEGVLLDNGPRPRGVTRHPWHSATLIIAKIREVKS